MEIVKAFKFRLKTSREIEQKFAQIAGCCRFVWNRTLAIQKERIELKFWHFSYEDTSTKLLTNWKKDKETSFLKDAPSQPLQQALRDLSKAIKDYFKKAGRKHFPKFKKKGIKASFRFPVYKNNVKIVNRRVKILKIGWVGFFKSREILGDLKNLTVSKQGKHWFASFQVNQNIDVPKRSKISDVGIDLGIAKFAALSNKEEIKSMYFRT